MTTVLIVDNKRQRKPPLMDDLYDAGFDVADASGDEAVEKAEQDQPDLIILDAILPGMNGLQVLEKLKQNPKTEAIPVIILTDLPAVRGEATAMRLGATNYLIRPPEPGVMEVSIRSAIREAKAAAGPPEVEEAGQEEGEAEGPTTEEKSVLDEPRSAADFTARGAARLNRGQIRLALEDFHFAIGRDRRFHKAYSGQAVAYTLLNQDYEAEQAVVKLAALGIDPTLVQNLMIELRKQR